VRGRSSRGMLLIALSACVACASAPLGPSPVPAGIWGGNDISMTIADAATHIEFDCAHGDIPGPITVDGGGRFDVTGTFVREPGGPVQLGAVPDTHPATYAGLITGPTMAVTVRLSDTGDLIGTFTLARGATGRVVKCV